ncbi:hypothetical protein F5Y19DRAFT_476606 [Xylariaceae sp. FL1651]|nr:hypothetical protein F5Y19DRAFT_476606 [Xylariaceae sp. FL1651]
MTWRETDQKGIFSRPIGGNETFIKLIGDGGMPLNHEHCAINSAATIVPTGSYVSADLAAHFRSAWAHLRFQHPSLAAEVAPDEKSYIYTTPADGTAPDAQVSQTFSVATDANSSADMIPTFQPTPYASTVCFVLRPYLREPYSTLAFAAGLYTTGWMKRKSITRELLDAHREYAAQLAKLIRSQSQGVGDSSSPPSPPPSEVDIRSIGVAEKLIRRFYGTPGAGFEVKAVSVGVESLSLGRP